MSRALIETHLRGSVLATLRLAAPWTIDFGNGDGIPVHCLLGGEGWLHRPGRAPVALAAGDLLMFPRWGAHLIAAAREPSPAITIGDLVRLNGRRVWSTGEWLDEPLPLELEGAGPRSALFSMVVEPQASGIRPLLAGLPDVVHVGGGDPSVGRWLRPVLDFLSDEVDDHRPGYAIVQSRLAELLFMQIVRSQLLARPERAGPDVRALLDLPIARAMAAMRAAPDRDWDLSGLAAAAGMSRSAFAQRFRAVTGATPFALLREIRLEDAARRLREGALVKEVVEVARYATHYSFAKSFARRFGSSPGRYRAGHLPRPPADGRSSG